MVILIRCFPTHYLVDEASWAGVIGYILMFLGGVWGTVLVKLGSVEWGMFTFLVLLAVGFVFVFFAGLENIEQERSSRSTN